MKRVSAIRKEDHLERCCNLKRIVFVYLVVFGAIGTVASIAVTRQRVPLVSYDSVISRYNLEPHPPFLPGVSEARLRRCLGGGAACHAKPGACKSLNGG